LKIGEIYRTLETLITSNTSGIPYSFLEWGRSLKIFRKHFLWLHTFLPRRYLNLFEIYTRTKTSFSWGFGVFNGLRWKQFLGKTSVMPKGHARLYGNRIGIFSIRVFSYGEENGLWPWKEVDKLTGPVIGDVPKNQQHLNRDVVGLRYLSTCSLMALLFDNCKDDEKIRTCKLPDFINFPKLGK